MTAFQGPGCRSTGEESARSALQYVDYKGTHEVLDDGDHIEERYSTDFEQFCSSKPYSALVSFTSYLRVIEERTQEILIESVEFLARESRLVYASEGRSSLSIRDDGSY